MNLYEALERIDRLSHIYDIGSYIGYISKRTCINLKGNYFYIQPKSIKDRFIIDILYNDIMKNSNSWRYNEGKGLKAFYEILKSINVDLYRLKFKTSSTYINISNI